MTGMNHLHAPDHGLAIHFTARHTAVPEHVVVHARERLSKAKRFGIPFSRIDVTVTAERNPRNSGASHRIEITGHSPGVVIRAESAAADWLTAFDQCLDRWHERARRHSERRAARRRGRYGHGSTDATVESAGDGLSAEQEVASGALLVDHDDVHDRLIGALAVREKVHSAKAMTVAEAIDAMELVGHDFYAFVERDTAQFCVVYQRKAFTYGLLRLASV